MLITSTVRTGVFVLFAVGCAAERLEARDPTSGPAGTDVVTPAIERPTELQRTEPEVGVRENQAPASSPVPADEHPAADQARPYVCPMHPEVRSDRKGRCPKCGMELTKEARP